MPKNYASDKKLCEKALQFVEPIYTKVTNGRSQFEEWLEMFYNMWQCKIDVQYYQGDSNIYIPIIRKNTEDGVNNIASKLFPTDDSFSVIPLPGTPSAFSEAVDILQKAQLEKIRMKTKIKPLLRYYIWSGSAFIKTFFDTYKRVPNFKVLDWRKDFYIYPETVDDVEEALITFEKLPVDKFELERLAGKKYDKDRVKELLQKNPDLPIQKQESDLNFKITKDRFKELPIYDLVESYTAFEVKDGKFEDVVISWSPIHRVVLQISPNELKDCQGHVYKPYLGTQQIKEPNNIYGHSIYEVGQRLQYLLNDITNVVIDDAMWILNPIVKGDISGVNNPQGLVMKRGAKWDMADPNQVQFDRPPDVLGSGLALVNQMKFILQEMTNIGAMTPMTSKRVTATEIATYSQLLGVFIGSTVSDIEESLMKPFLQRMYDLNQQYLSKDELKAILGKKAFDIQKLGSRKNGLWSFGYDFKWLGSTQSMNMHIKSAQMIQFLEVASRIPKTPEDSYVIDFGDILKSIWKYGFDLPNVEKVVKDKLASGLDPEEENKLMADGKEVEVNLIDKDMEHIVSHNISSEKPEIKDNKAIFDIHVRHIQKHLQQMKKKLNEYNQQVGQNQLAGGGQGQPAGGGQPNMPNMTKAPETMGQVVKKYERWTVNIDEFLSKLPTEETPKDVEEKNKLIEKLDVKLGIFRVGKETEFWKEIGSVIEEKIFILKRDMERYHKEQITKVSNEEFVTTLLGMDKLLEALERLKNLPDILCRGYEAGIKNLQVTRKDVNFWVVLKIAFKGVKTIGGVMVDEKKDVKTEVPETSTGTEKVEKEDNSLALKERISELSAEKRDLSEQLSALTNTVQGLINKPKEEEDDPDLDPNIKKIQKQIKELGGALASNLDNQDRIDVRLDSRINQKDYAKREKEIEKLRKDYAVKEGRVLSRKEIYFFLKGQEEKHETKPEIKDEDERKSQCPETKTTVKDTKSTPKSTEDLEKKLEGVII